MKQIQKYYFMPMALALVMALVLSAPGRSLAAPIAPGFDLFTTPDGTAFIDLSATGLGLGIVDLNGNPIPGAAGDADTIVERLTSLGAGQTGTIDIELVALSLRSVDPVALNIGTGDAFFDLFVTLDESIPSLGQMTILTHDDNQGANGGGTFVSFFDVFVEITLIGTSTGFPLVLLSMDPYGAPATPNGWIHRTNGDFFAPDGVEHTGPHPSTSAIPLPAALPLYGTGLAVMGFLGWRRKRQQAA